MIKAYDLINSCEELVLLQELVLFSFGPEDELAAVLKVNLKGDILYSFGLLDDLLMLLIIIFNRHYDEVMIVFFDLRQGIFELAHFFVQVDRLRTELWELHVEADNFWTLLQLLLSFLTLLQTLQLHQHLVMHNQAVLVTFVIVDKMLQK